MPRVIKKKTWPDYFEKILDGSKCFDARIADFEVSVGDTLVFQEWDPETNDYTGREIEKKITFLSKIADFDFFSKEDIDKHGLVIMSLK